MNVRMSLSDWMKVMAALEVAERDAEAHPVVTAEPDDYYRIRLDLIHQLSPNHWGVDAAK